MNDLFKNFFDKFSGLSPEEQKSKIEKLSKQIVDNLGEDAWIFLILMLFADYGIDFGNLPKFIDEASTDTLQKGEQDHGQN